MQESTPTPSNTKGINRKMVRWMGSRKSKATSEERDEMQRRLGHGMSARQLFRHNRSILTSVDKKTGARTYTRRNVIEQSVRYPEKSAS